MRFLMPLAFVACATTVGAPYVEKTPPDSRARWLSWRASQEGRSLDEQRVWDEGLSQGKRPQLDLEDVGFARRAHGLFHQYCAPCHGAPGASPLAANVPRLGGRGYRMGMMMGGDKMATGVFKTIAAGRNEMPGFAGQMTNEQIWLLVEYLRSF